MKHVSRRQVLQGLGACAGATLIGCGAEGGEELGIAESAIGGTPEALLAHVKNIVVLCMENRSFDHYLGSLKRVEQRSVNGLTGSESNPAPDGSEVKVFNLQTFTPADPPHEWDSSRLQWNEGKNDGFVIAHAGPNQEEAMGYYVRAQLPTTYALADAFTVCDAYHASVMGPTWPNRFYLHGGTSHGVKNSTPIPGFKSIFDVLTLHGITNLNYFCDVPFATAAYGKVLGVAPIEAFFAQAAAGLLPRFSMIDPQYLGPTANDDHPAHDVRLGQALIASVYAALAKSPQWKNTLFIITYDEHGGFYDHVSPGQTVDERPEFEQLGFRIPALCIGPTVKQGTVSTVFEHVSVLKTLALRHGLEPLNERVAAANDFSSVIDPALVKNPRPAPKLAPLEISKSQLADRIAKHPLALDESHLDFVLACETGLVPKTLDRRADGMGVFASVLAWGEKLGALKIVP